MGYIQLTTYVRVLRTPKGGTKAVNTFEAINNVFIQLDSPLCATVLKDELNKTYLYQISLLNGISFIIDADGASNLGITQDSKELTRDGDIATKS